MKKYFFAFSIIGITIYILQKLEISLPTIINNYVNDFLIVPIVLLLSLFVSRKLRNNNKYKFSVGIILYICILYALIFEYYLPKSNPRYTSDIIDVGLYFLGGFVFWKIQKNN